MFVVEVLGGGAFTGCVDAMAVWRMGACTAGRVEFWFGLSFLGEWLGCGVVSCGL